MVASTSAGTKVTGMAGSCNACTSAVAGGVVGVLVRVHHDQRNRLTLIAREENLFPVLIS
ncbi:MAG TPA: hypothetical protein VIX14_00815 [Terriglobales bacterium]